MSQNLNKVHVIALGGSVMSSLAVALKSKGLDVTGSDDKIYDPAKSLLEQHNLLPQQIGWNPDHITNDLDAVILGMHAKEDNPELLKAKELGVAIYSYPEFIRSQCEDKQRIVIAGSHGKTSITGMIMHVLRYWNRSFDYLVGAAIPGFENSIQLSDAPIIVIEGDEYFSSPLDLSPKFLKYDHHIALISGTSWDHINVYPTLESYVEQFEKLGDRTPKAGTLVFCETDEMAYVIGNKERDDVKAIPYSAPKYSVKNGIFYIKSDNGEVPLKVIGRYNMENVEGARNVLDRIGITSTQFFEAIQSFDGAGKRNDLVADGNSVTVYSDFAHAPSKLKSTVEGHKELHPKRKLTACYELHTFSSLNKEFIDRYKNTFSAPDEAIIFVDEEVLASKGKKNVISLDDIQKAFKRKDLSIYSDIDELSNYLLSKKWKSENLIFMSSGNFGGLDISELAHKIID